jgi:hypothetical protein
MRLPRGEPLLVRARDVFGQAETPTEYRPDEHQFWPRRQVHGHRFESLRHYRSGPPHQFPNSHVRTTSTVDPELAICINGDSLNNPFSASVGSIRTNLFVERAFNRHAEIRIPFAHPPGPWSANPDVPLNSNDPDTVVIQNVMLRDRRDFGLARH